MARIVVLIIALAATLAATVDFSWLHSGPAPSADDIRLAFDRGLTSAPDAQIQTTITQLDPARCVAHSSPVYASGIYRCRVTLETSLATGERHASDASLVLAPFEREWTVISFNTIAH